MPRDSWFIPFPSVVLSEYSDHSLDWTQNGSVDDHWSGFIISIFPAMMKTVVSDSKDGSQYKISEPYSPHVDEIKADR